LGHCGHVAAPREVVDAAEWPAAAPGASLSTEGRLGEPLTVRMEPVDDGVYEARVTLPDDRVVIPAVALPTGPVVGPAVALPYSPEAAPRGGVGAGLAALTALARDGGGVVRADLTGVFENPPSRGQRTELAALLVALALLALVVEVATRRLALAWPRLGRGLGAALRARWSRRRRRAVTPEPPRAEAGDGTETAPPPGSSPPGAAEGRGSVGDALRELRKRRG
ncbi:MAG: hypothetical protein KC635_06520, partial [Myxococcales bacterium]|nr:hypothetical protein [Myxococcales bacterium]